MNWYCDAAKGHPWHEPYHNTDYGFPVVEESVLLERLALEINQAGLSWLIVLKKREAFSVAFDEFEVDRVAAFGEADRARLLSDAGIIRNRLKVDAVIHNAGCIQDMRDSHGGFHAWLEAHHPMRKEDWVKLFKKTFRFTGGEITGEFLMSTGYLPGTHSPDCPTYRIIAALAPPWMQAPAGFWE